MMCFPLSHLLIDRYFQLIQRIRFAFHVRNCLLVRLTCHGDTRHTEPHSNIFLMRLCYDAVPNCADGKRTITLKKRGTNHPTSQSVSLPVSPCCDPGCVSVQIAGGGKSRAWSQTLVILARMTPINQIEALDEASYPVSKRHHDRNWIGQ